ncbi:hypothetical protein ABVK25_009544 [Lepraria finkii]|uniref:Ribonuclease P protein subunit n=1 Tax=Lepraria finkii TaxID=1340010 RepID=A0ABR4B322_9LECA
MASSKHIAQVLLDQAYPPEAAAAIFTEKVLRKPLHLRPTSPDPSSQDARARRRLQRLRKEEKTRRRQKTKPLSAKEKRISGIYDIPDDQKKYEIYVPLHRMWLGYMWEILGMREGEKAYVTAQGAGSKLASADYHGAEVIVVRGRCVGMVGLTGIVVRDTKFTFQIITKKNELKTIPKRHTVFRFNIPQPEGKRDEAEGLTEHTKKENESPARSLVFELHGSQFEHRAIDRATKKFKQSKSLIDL